MRGVSTFGAFTTARLGIYAAQKGLDVTGHNISNINTLGYTRQRLDQMALRTGGTDRYVSSYDASVGSGVLCTGVSQLRDPYLDIRYRNENSSLGAMDAKLSGLEDLSSILDEVTKGDGSGLMEAQFNDLVDQLRALSLDAGLDDTSVRTSADALTQLFNKYAERLQGIQEDQADELHQDVDTVSSILSNIRDLNNSIQKSEIHGDSALELKDQRNNLIDSLSQYMKISVEYEAVSVGAGATVDKMVIKTAGNPQYTLVDGSYSAKLSVRKDAAGIESPNYDLDLGPLTNAGGEILSKNGVASVTVELGDSDLYGSLQAVRETLTEAGVFTSQDTIDNVDPNGATKRGIPYYQKALDSLAQKFAAVLNEGNTGYLRDASGNYVDQTGAPITYLDGGVQKNLTTKTVLTGALEQTLKTQGILLGGPLFSNNASGNDTTGITAANITISKDWQIGDIKIVNSFIMGTNGNGVIGPSSTDTANILHLKALMESEQSYKASDIVNDAVGGNNSVFFKGSFQQMLSKIELTLANDTKATASLLDSYAGKATELNTSRSSVSGVDLNDEATSLMQYQKSYAAACRLMTTLDEVLDKLINGTGIVGR